MQENRMVSVPCPVCGVSQVHHLAVSESTSEAHLVRCRGEDWSPMGCGALFAVEVRVTVTLDVQTCTLALPCAAPFPQDALAY